MTDDIGRRVFILKDCRENPMATGMMGVIESCEVAGVSLMLSDDEDIAGMSYEAYQQAELLGIKFTDHYPDSGNPTTDTTNPHAIIWSMPCIRLDDGDVIYGYECFWSSVPPFEGEEGAE
jgi:hypothetical protein